MTPVDNYLKEVRPAQRKELERIRKIVKKLAPDAEETISYGIPTFKYMGTYLFYFAAFKNHMSVFPGGYILGEMKDKLSKYQLSKGTVQFSEDNPLPENLIKEMVEQRLKIINKRTK